MDLDNIIKLPNDYILEIGKHRKGAILYNNQREIIRVYTSDFDIEKIREEAFIDFRKRNIGIVYPVKE